MRTLDSARGLVSGRRHRPTALILTIMIWALMLGLPLVSGCADDDAGPANQSPRLTLDVGAAESYVVGDFIQIRANAEDPDGDELSFSVVGLPARADLHTFANSALMSWDPIASDVTADEPLRLVFVVEDGRGGRAERVVNVTITAGNSAPVFTSPSSKLYDPTSRQPLKFEVKVRADAATQVTLTMPAETAPEGAQLVQNGPKSAEFSWKPNAEQREGRVHSVIFVADDGLGALVEQKVTIVFQTGGGGTSGPTPSTDPTCDVDRLITHGSPGPQRTLEDYELRANLSEAAAARYEEGFIFWSVDDPMNYDVEFNVVEMKLGNGLMRGGIPNLLLTAGESQTVYYTICAMDTEADPDDPEGFICAPPGYYYSFVAYSPGATQCVDDTHAGTSFAAAAPVPETEWGDYRMCDGGADYHKVTVTAGGLVEVYVLYTLNEAAGDGPPAHGLSITVYDEAQTPQDVAVISDCEGMAYMALDAPAGAAKTWYIQVKSKDGAELPYEMGAIRADTGEACVDDDRFGGDNRDINGAERVSSETYEGLTLCTDAPDWYYAWVGAGQTLLLEVLVGEGATAEDVYLDLYDFDGFWLDEAYPDENRLGLEFTAPESAIYHFTVDSPLDIRYTLTVVNEADEPSPTCVDNDAFGSENRDFEGAKIIRSGTYEGLTLCADQPDWYFAWVDAGETVLAELSVEDGPSVDDVYLDVYDFDNNWLQEAFPEGSSLDLEFIAPESGTYLFQVDAPADTRYTLTFFNQSDP